MALNFHKITGKQQNGRQEVPPHCDDSTAEEVSELITSPVKFRGGNANMVDY